jgi:hypothetical protein
VRDARQEKCLGLGSELVTARTVEGRFPNINQVIPKKRPLFTFRVDPKVLAETLLAMADLLPDHARGVQVFFYGDNLPIGFCAQNSENGLMIDALVVPLVAPKAEDKPQEPKPNGKKDEPGQPQPPQQEASAPEAETARTAAPEAANGQKSKPKRSKKS